MNTISTSNETPVDWNEYARCYDTLKKLTPYSNQLARVAEIIAALKPKSLLDVGCGTGNLLSLLEKKYSDINLVGIDDSEVMLSRATQKLQTQVHSADINQTLPFFDQTFHSIACMQVLYAVTDPQQTLHELYRMLRPNGSLVLVTPDTGHDNGLILKAHAQSSKPDSYWQHPHTSELRENTLLHEALSDTELEHAMRTVAYHNRLIATTATFHFFTKKDLLSLVQNASFTISHYERTYAHQCHLIVAKKEILR